MEVDADKLEVVHDPKVGRFKIEVEGLEGRPGLRDGRQRDGVHAHRRAAAAGRTGRGRTAGADRVGVRSQQTHTRWCPRASSCMCIFGGIRSIRIWWWSRVVCRPPPPDPSPLRGRGEDKAKNGYAGRPPAYPFFARLCAMKGCAGMNRPSAWHGFFEFRRRRALRRQELLRSAAERVAPWAAARPPSFRRFPIPLDAAARPRGRWSHVRASQKPRRRGRSPRRFVKGL